jgi:hypothetical protein
MGRRYTPLRYPTPLASETLAEENGRRLRQLYRRLFGKEPAFESSATEPLVRELEFQEAMKAEIQRRQLAQEPEFHNEPGRPKGSKNRTRRPLKPEAKMSKAAIRKRRQREKSVTDN